MARESFSRMLIRPIYRQRSRAVVFVDHRVYLDDFEAQHAAVIGDDFHGQVSLAIGSAPAHRSSHPGRIFGINPVHVEGNV